MTEIEQIKVALEKVDAGTWIAQEDCQICKGNGFTIFYTESGYERDECSCLIPENRMFNANAPDYISSLITTIESQKEEIKRYNELFQEIGIMCAFEQPPQILRILSVLQKFQQEGDK